MAALNNRACKIALSIVVLAVFGLFILSFLMVFISERFVGVKRVSEDITPTGVICTGVCVARSGCQERGGFEVGGQSKGCDQFVSEQIGGFTRTIPQDPKNPIVCCLNAI